jgi:hypothetical protein
MPPIIELMRSRYPNRLITGTSTQAGTSTQTKPARKEAPWIHLDHSSYQQHPPEGHYAQQGEVGLYGRQRIQEPLDR